MPSSRRRNSHARIGRLRLGGTERIDPEALTIAARREADPRGIAEQISAFFDGRQLDPSSFGGGTSPGYARP